MSTKHAYLIIAHNEFELLKALLTSLDYEDNDIYLHIDKKAGDINALEFQKCLNHSTLYILEQRMDVQWGNYSQIACELLLLKAASKNHYNYYHLCSGVDLPIKSQDEIHRFFDLHAGKEFVQFEGLVLSSEERYRVSKYHFVVKRKRNFFEKVVYHTLLMFQFAIDRTKKNNWEYVKGANWFSITDELVRFVLDSEEVIAKAFKYTRCADEIFLQTLVYNSKFRERLYNQAFDDDYAAICYEIDWNRGKPYTYRDEDFPILMNSSQMFARKFSWNQDCTVIKRIVDQVSCK